MLTPRILYIRSFNKKIPQSCLMRDHGIMFAARASGYF